MTPKYLLYYLGDEDSATVVEAQSREEATRLAQSAAEFHRISVLVFKLVQEFETIITVTPKWIGEGEQVDATG